MTPKDYKKDYKPLYQPKTPAIVEVEEMQFVAVEGRGDPNDENGNIEFENGFTDTCNTVETHCNASLRQQR